MNQIREFIKRCAVKYKEIVIIAILMWCIFAIGVTFDIVILKRHVKQLEEKVANQEATIDSLMDDVIELENK